MLIKQIVKNMTHCPLRHGKSRTLCIGTVAHQCQHSLSANFGKTLQVNGISEYRCIIHLKVSGVDNNAYR